MNFGLSVGSIVLLFLVLEVIARFTLPQAPTVRVDNVAQESFDKVAEKDKRVLTSQGYGMGALFRGTPTGLRLNRNVIVTIEKHALNGLDIEIKTNSYGYRPPDLDPKTSKDFRTLVLGDSITLGDYLPVEQTYPSYMEQDLRGHNKSEKNIQVINAGTSSIDLRSYFQMLMETGIHTQPDLVVVGLYLNDADTSFVLEAVTYPAWIRLNHLNVVAKLSRWQHEIEPGGRRLRRGID